MLVQFAGTEKNPIEVLSRIERQGDAIDVMRGLRRVTFTVLTAEKNKDRSNRKKAKVETW
jgi:hypothetical protein